MSRSWTHPHLCETDFPWTLQNKLRPVDTLSLSSVKPIFWPFYGCVILYCIYVPHLLLKKIFLICSLFFWMCCTACRILVPWPRIEPGPSAVKVPSPNHWTIGEVPQFSVFVTTSISSVQSLSRVRFFATPWIAACQASLSITNSQSSHKLTSIELVMPPSHLILCRPLFLLRNYLFVCLCFGSVFFLNILNLPSFSVCGVGKDYQTWICPQIDTFSRNEQWPFIKVGKTDQ